MEKIINRRKKESVKAWKRECKKKEKGECWRGNKPEKGRRVCRKGRVTARIKRRESVRVKVN